MSYKIIIIPVGVCGLINDGHEKKRSISYKFMHVEWKANNRKCSSIEHCGARSSAHTIYCMSANVCIDEGVITAAIGDTFAIIDIGFSCVVDWREWGICRSMENPCRCSTTKQLKQKENKNRQYEWTNKNTAVSLIITRVIDVRH